jgi:hypothetical protein
VIEAEGAGIAAIKKNADELTNAIATSRANTDANVQAVAASKAQTEKDAATAKSASEQATASNAAIEKSKTEVAAMLAESLQHANSVRANKVDAEQSIAELKKSQQDLVQIAAQSKAEADNIAKFHSDAKTTYPEFQKVVDIANSTHAIILAHEAKMAALVSDFEKVHQKIEGLLPNATSAGLASAFRTQKERFKRPQMIWLVTFVATIVSLLLFGWANLQDFKETDTFDMILRHMTSRLPIIVPLVWLALYSGRNYMLTLRLEEEYAFKEAVSTAFEGYKREMQGIEQTEGNIASPITTLCNNVLQALAQRPGRIYEGRHEDITPLSPVKGMFGMNRPEKKGKPEATEE